MWLPNYPQGPTLAEAQAGFHVGGGGGIPEWLANRPNPIAEATQQAIAAIAEILQKRRQDQIANQLLAVEQAPKAKAVSGMEPDTTKYQPDTQLTQAMVAQNLAGGYPTKSTVPDLGGVQGLKFSDELHRRMMQRQKEQWETEDRPLDVAYKQAQTSHLLQPPRGYKPEPIIQTPTGPKPASQANYDRLTAEKPKTDTIEALDKELKAQTGLPYHVWANAADKRIGTTDPKTGAYVNDQRFHAKVADPDDASKTKDISMPVDLYEKMKERYGSLGRTQPGAPAGTEGKHIDAQTAQEFLRQAGGDKDKARELARAAGYTF
jgi:hypothetical protein